LPRKSINDIDANVTQLRPRSPVRRLLTRLSDKASPWLRGILSIPASPDSSHERTTETRVRFGYRRESKHFFVAL